MRYRFAIYHWRKLFWRWSSPNFPFNNCFKGLTTQGRLQSEERSRELSISNLCPSTSIKGKVLIDLVAEFTESPIGEDKEEQGMDGKSVDIISS